jgi:hypothetical protein
MTLDFAMFCYFYQLQFLVANTIKLYIFVLQITLIFEFLFAFLSFFKILPCSFLHKSDQQKYFFT